ncbi:MAG: HNH endonuclease [Mycobacterium sp.]
MTNPPSTRRGGEKWQKFRDALKAEWRKRDAPCWRCGGRILWDGPANYSQSYECDHVVPVSVDPSRMWDKTNLAPAHVACHRSLTPPEPPPPGEWVKPSWL